MELFAAIALLCQVSAGGEKGFSAYIHKTLDAYQHDCQKYYAHCMIMSKEQDQHAMTKCIMERKL